MIKILAVKIAYTLESDTWCSEAVIFNTVIK